MKEPAPAPPWFLTVFVTFTVIPGAVAVGASVAADTTRSGPMMIGVAVAFTLLASVGLSASTTVLVALAWAITKYRPGAVPDGISTLFVTVASAPPASAPTGRSPPSWTSLPSSVASVDRNSRETVAGAPPVATARFFTTWVTLTFVPAAATAGAVTDVTARSARATVSGTTRMLLASLASATSPGALPVMSARTIRK